VISSFSPQQPKDLVVEVSAATRDDVRATYTRARTAQRAWGAAPAAARAAALTEAAAAVDAARSELADLVVREVGKPLAESRAEVARSVAILRYYAQQVFDPTGAMHEPSAQGLLFTQRRPRGVAGLITPWNFPLAIPLWKAAPALAFGNTVVLKPAPESTACALRLAELVSPALPADAFAVVPGDVETGQAVVEGADVVSFTGSTTGGRAVTTSAAERSIPVQAEMGGQNPAVVLPDADVDAAAQQMAAAAMGFAGQKCTATKRVVVVGAGDAIRDALVAAVEAMQVADPADDRTTVGPVISEQARQRVTSVARDAESVGGRVLTGGTDADLDGWFVKPTLVEGVPDGHALACEEVFGPICLLQSAADLDEGIRIANAVPHGLAAALYTKDLGTALEAAQRLEAGLVKVNAPTSGVDFYLPFGGEKASSFGSREQGKAAQQFYTSTHTVTLAP
jgi:alpha-ketoglutaric semialdehyde dehydrogenase